MANAGGPKRAQQLRSNSCSAVWYTASLFNGYNSLRRSVVLGFVDIPLLVGLGCLVVDGAMSG
jgi:hypothetical protein